MKTRYPQVVALFALLAVFSTSYAQYDDIYYTPENDITYNNEATYNNDVTTTQYEWTEEDEYVQGGNDTYITNNYYYASRIKRFRRPVSRFGYYNNCYTQTYYYDYNPYSCGTSIYNNSFYSSGWYAPSPFIVLNIGNNWCRPRYSYYNYNSFCAPNYYSTSYYNPYGYYNPYNYGFNNSYGYNNPYYGNNAYCGPGNNSGGNYYTTTGGPRTGRDRIIRNNGTTRTAVQTDGISNGKERVIGTQVGISDGKEDQFNNQPIKSAPVKSVKDRYETDQPQWTIKESKPKVNNIKDTKPVSDQIQTIKNPKQTSTPVKSITPSIKAQKPRSQTTYQNPRTDAPPVKVQKPRTQPNNIKTQKPRTQPNTIKVQKPRTTSKPNYTKPRTTSKPTYTKPRTTSKPSYTKPKSSSSQNRSTLTKRSSSSSSKGRR